MILKEKPWINRYLKHGLDEKILDVLNLETYCFKDWYSNSKIGLFLYAQLVNSFGWNSYKTLFREYESLSEKEDVLIKKNNLDNVIRNGFTPILLNLYKSYYNADKNKEILSKFKSKQRKNLRELRKQQYDFEREKVQFFLDFEVTNN